MFSRWISTRNEQGFGGLLGETAWPQRGSDSGSKMDDVGDGGGPSGADYTLWGSLPQRAFNVVGFLGEKF